MCFDAHGKRFKQRDVNPLLWMQVNEDGSSGILYQEIYTIIFPNMDHYQVVDSVKYKKYCSQNGYNIHKHINSNAYVTAKKC